MPAPMPISLHQLRIAVLVPVRSLTRGFRAAVRRPPSVLVLTLDPSNRAVGFEGGFALGVRGFGSGSLFEGCGFGLLEFRVGGFEGLFGEFLLGGAGAFGASPGGVALAYGGCWVGVDGGVGDWRSGEMVGESRERRSWSTYLSRL